MLCQIGFEEECARTFNSIITQFIIAQSILMGILIGGIITYLLYKYHPRLFNLKHKNKSKK